MSKMQVCDRCGKVVSTSENRHIWAYLSKCRWNILELEEIGMVDKKYDLCGDCARDLKMWINKKDI